MHDYGALQMEPLNIRIPSEDYRKLEQIATDTGMTISDVGREAISRYLGRSGAGGRARSRLATVEGKVARLMGFLRLED
jgi:predicted transcriptional regulator